MGLPPASVLFQPVTCMPAWVGKYALLPNTTVASGCSTANGNVQCDPRAMATAAAKKTGLPVTLEAYTLARYVTSEVGTRSVPERVAVLQAALNRARYVERLPSVLNLLLYRQSPTGAQAAHRGYYGPIHSGGDLAAPYGRWASTARDPAYSNIALAIAVLNGEIPESFSKGADDQYGPEILVTKQGLAVTQNGVRRRGGEHRYWVGPLPGVDHMRTFLYTTRRDISPTSPEGKALIERGVAAISSGRPNWSGLTVCAAEPGMLDTPGAKAAAVVVGGATAAALAVVGAAVWRRRRVMV
jgi:hypothetical protein